VSRPVASETAPDAPTELRVTPTVGAPHEAVRGLVAMYDVLIAEQARAHAVEKAQLNYALMQERESYRRAVNENARAHETIGELREEVDALKRQLERFIPEDS